MTQNELSFFSKLTTKLLLIPIVIFPKLTTKLTPFLKKLLDFFKEFMSILGKKLKFCEKCWLFHTIVHYSYWKTCLFSENCDFLYDFLYTSRNCRILIKTLFVHVLIFIKVFYWLEKCYFDSKFDILDKSVIFLVKFTFQVA